MSLIYKFIAIISGLTVITILNGCKGALEAASTNLESEKSISESLSSLIADTYTIDADGFTNSEVTLTLVDKNNNPLSGKVVLISSNRGAADVVYPVEGITDLLGKVKFRIKSSQAGAATLSVTDKLSSIQINQKATVNFKKVYGAIADQGSVDSNTTYSGDMYFIDCNGDDNNDGKSPFTPWKTLNKVRTKINVGYWDTVAPNANTNPSFHPAWISAKSGSAFLFKRGCVFTGNIKISAYVLNPLGGSGWFNDNFVFGAYGDSSMVRPIIQNSAGSADSLFNSSGYKFHIRNLHLIDKSSVTGIWMNNSKDSSIINSVIEDAGSDGITADHTENILIKNCVLKNNQKGGGRGGGIAGSGKNFQILNSTFIDNGRDQIGAHNVYLRELEDAVIKGNYFKGGSNMGLVIHGRNLNVLISQNEFDANNNALSVSSGYYSGEVEVADQIEISENKIHDSGYRSGEQGYCMILDSVTNISVVNNICYNNRLGGVSLSDGPSKDIPSDKVKIYNNIFYEKMWYALSIRGARLGQLFVNNNILINLSADAPVLEIHNSAFLAGVSLDRNLYYSPNRINLIYFKTASMNFASFKTASSLEATGLNSNPDFVDVANSNFHLLNTSVAKSAGLNVGLVVDFEGNTRNLNSPSLGAFE